MVAAQRGDAAVQAEFLREMAALVRGYFRRRLSQLPNEVEDLVQETLLAVHSKRHTYDPQQPISAWIGAIARYRLVDLLRVRSGREVPHEPFDKNYPLLASDAELTAQEARRDLAHPFADLPDKQRLPIRHVNIEGPSVAQAVQRTVPTDSSVKVGVHRGLRALAARIRGVR